MANWNETTVLTNFRHLRAGQFDPLRAEFGIGLSDEKLTGCAVHCALALRRDPTVGELLLWDRLAKIPSPITQKPLTALETESAALAETYADMMAKRRDLSLDSPMTLCDAFTPATDALTRGGKEAALKTCDLRLTDLFSAPYAQSGIVGANSPAFLSIRKKSLSFTPFGAGDLCLLLETGSLLQYAFWQALFPIMEAEEFQSDLRALFPVGEGGLLPALLSRFDGLTVDLSRLEKPDFSLPDLLAGAFAKDRILTVSESAAEKIAAKLRACGIKTTIFAQLTGGRQVTLIGRGKWADSTDFLRSLAPESSALSLTLQADKNLTAPITLGARSGYACKFLPAEGAFGQSAAAAGLSVSAATAELTDGAFSTAVLASLSPVFACALAGVDYSEMRLAVDLALPRAENTDPANAFAAAIGLYRVQAELGIPAAQARIGEQDIPAPLLSIFALGKGVGTPAQTLAQKDSKIYLIPVALSPEGLPDFAEVRVLLADLAAQAKHGVIRSARVVLQTSPKAALAAMKNDCLTAKPNRGVKGYKEPLALGVLIESGYEMPFDCIATVTERKAAQTVNPTPEKPAQPDPFRIPQGKGLIWRTSPEVVILAPESEPDALALSRFLGEGGASVSIFTPAEKERFLRAVLTASVVYRFPNVRLWRDTKTLFALSVLRGNGGEVRCLKNFSRKKGTPI